jgi:ABC-2 type transport system permease protein
VQPLDRLVQVRALPDIDDLVLAPLLDAGSVQAAQGLSLIAFVFAFLSSTYVPVSSMPGWLQLFAKHQPMTPMVDAVRALILGSGSNVVPALAWSAVLLAVFTPIAALRYRRA